MKKATPPPTPPPEPTAPENAPKPRVYMEDLLKDDSIYKALRQVSNAVQDVVHDHIASVAEGAGLSGYSYATPEPPPPSPKEEPLPHLTTLAYDAEQQAARVQSMARLFAEGVRGSQEEIRDCFEGLAQSMQMVCDNLSELVCRLPEELKDEEEGQP